MWTQCLRGMDLLNHKLLSMIWKQNLITEREGKKKSLEMRTKFLITGELKL